MAQSQTEKNFLDSLYEKKAKVPYEFNYHSSSFKTTCPTLGTIESDACGRYGRWAEEPFRAFKLAQLASTIPSLNTVLDVGAGNLLATNFFITEGKIVDISDMASSPYLNSECLQSAKVREFCLGNFNEYNFTTTYDLVWASHVLEHQPNIDLFLRKLVSLVSPGGYLAIAVPPRKPFIVSGHINLFNPGLLIYRLILAGIDCTDSKIFQYDGNICFLAKVKRIDLPPLSFDIGDIDLLAGFFPGNPVEGFNGDIMHSGLTPDEEAFVYCF
jgi:SAM-dependent methyltransferase